MRRLTLVLLLAAMLSSSAFAQGPPDPRNFHIIYGSRDGSPLPVQLNSMIEVPIWAATDPRPGNPDTVVFMHNPLASNPLYIVSRDGGIGTTSCDTFMPPENNSQSHFRFAYFHDPPDPLCPVYTLGDTILLATFLMTTANDPSYIGQTVCPFAEGLSPGNGGLLWGMQDGVRGVVPIQTYGCLYFIAPCDYILGDINGFGPANGLDVVYGVNYFKGGPPPPVSCDICPEPPPFYAAADVNGTCTFNGIDISYFVNYLKGGSGLIACPDCPPGR